MNFIFINEDTFYNLEEERGMIAVRPTFTAPKKIKEFISVMGKSSLLSKDTGAYEERNITVPLTFSEYDINNFKLFELEGKRGKLYFPYYFPDTYFEVENISNIDIEDKFGVGEGNIEFTCNSFRCSDPKILTINKAQDFNIKGTIDTKPVITIKGTGDVSFSLNGNGISIKNIESSITIDLESMEIYKKNSDGTLIQQGSKVVAMNLTKIKLLAKDKNSIKNMTSNITAIEFDYKELYI